MASVEAGCCGSAGNVRLDERMPETRTSPRATRPANRLCMTVILCLHLPWLERAVQPLHRQRDRREVPPGKCGQTWGRVPQNAHRTARSVLCQIGRFSARRYAATRGLTAPENRAFTGLQRTAPAPRPDASAALTSRAWRHCPRYSNPGQVQVTSASPRRFRSRGPCARCSQIRKRLDDGPASTFTSRSSARASACTSPLGRRGDRPFRVGRLMCAPENPPTLRSPAAQPVVVFELPRASAQTRGE